MQLIQVAEPTRCTPQDRLRGWLPDHHNHMPRLTSMSLPDCPAAFYHSRNPRMPQSAGSDTKMTYKLLEVAHNGLRPERFYIITAS
jgi:hypothetical protein